MKHLEAGLSETYTKRVAHNSSNVKSYLCVKYLFAGPPPGMQCMHSVEMCPMVCVDIKNLEEQLYARPQNPH